MTPLDPLRVSLRGTALIEASAGTGKTHTITTLYVRLLLEQELMPERILVVTYTNAATAELRTRIRERLRQALVAVESNGKSGDETLDALAQSRRRAGLPESDAARLRAAVYGFDEAAIFTIHGFCQRALQEHAFESGVAFDVELITDETALRDEVVRDYWTRSLYDAPLAVARKLRRVKLSTLTQIARLVTAHPDMPVLPRAAPTVDDEFGSAAWRSARDRVAAILGGEFAGISSLLEAHPALNRNKYRAASIRGWMETLAELLVQGWPGTLAESDLKRFARTSIESGCKAGQAAPRHPFFDACQELLEIDAPIAAALEASKLRFHLGIVDYARTEMPRRKEAHNVQYFDDLLQRLDAALSGPGGPPLAARLSGRYAAALIDEFQDTDPVQYRIFRRCFGGTGSSLFLIGDPKQSIYAFRGADVFAYIAAKTETPARTTLTLGTNYRSDPALIRGVNTIFSRAAAPFVFTEMSFVPVSPAPSAADRLGVGPLSDSLGESGRGVPPRDRAESVTESGRGVPPRAPSPQGSAIAPPEDAAGRASLRRASGTPRPAALQFLFAARGEEKKLSAEWRRRRLPGAVAAEILRLRETGTTVGGEDLEWRHVAVLCRTNQQAREIQEALRRARVPSVLQGDASVFDSSEAEDLERILRATVDPGDAAAARAALATRPFGVDAAGLHVLLGDERAWEERIQQFQSWHESWRRDGFIPAFRRLLADAKVQPRLLAQPDGERQLTNLFHLGELLHTAASEMRRGPAALVQWLATMRNDPVARAGLVGEAAQIRLESDAHAVKLLTIHRSKGLEYEVVVCPYLWDLAGTHPAERDLFMFHDPTDDRRLKLALGPPEVNDFQPQRDLEALAEQLRLLYVALTRAKALCLVVWGHIGNMPKSALAYLVHRPQQLRGSALEEVQGRAKSLTDAQIRADLEELARESGGGIGVRDLLGGQVYPSPGTGRAAETASEGYGEADRTAAMGAATAAGATTDRSHESVNAAPALAARPAQRTLNRFWRMSSFSGLIAAREESAVGMGVADAADRDEDAGEPRPASAESPLALRDFPAGPRGGTAIHEMFEHLDFADVHSAETTAVISAVLRARGMDEALEPSLRRALVEIVDTPLDAAPAPLNLRQLTRGQRLNEMEFTLPVADGQPLALTCERLASAFAHHGRPPLPIDYPDRIRRLGFLPLEGFLRGFIDLIFEHGGRWYVADYKSNDLGPRPTDYLPQRLGSSMVEHHYYLQYHLYTVALHRYLTHRLGGYDYDRHFGGVYYFFVRGMAPHHPPGCGIYFDRPDRSLIDALSAALAGGAP